MFYVKKTEIHAIFPFPDLYYKANIIKFSGNTNVRLDNVDPKYTSFKQLSEIHFENQNIRFSISPHIGGQFM